MDVDVSVTDDLVSGPKDSVRREDVVRALYDHRRLELLLFGQTSWPILGVTTSHEQARRAADELGIVLEEVCQGSVGHALAWTISGCLLGGLVLQACASTYVDGIFSRIFFVLPFLLAGKAISSFSVRAGVDGITASEPLRADRFWAYGAIDHIHAHQHVLTLTLRHGGSVELRLRRYGGHGALAELQARIGESIAARKYVVDHRAQAALDPRRHPPDEWLIHLRGLRSDGYRILPLDDDALWRTVEDHGEDEAIRAAAAIVLGSELDAEGRRRLRLALSDNSSWTLRRAVQNVIDGHIAEAEKVARALAFPGS